MPSALRIAKWKFSQPSGLAVSRPMEAVHSLNSISLGGLYQSSARGASVIILKGGNTMTLCGVGRRHGRGTTRSNTGAHTACAGLM